MMNLLQEQITECGGLTVHTIKTSKYKTNTIILKIKEQLSEETASMRSLLPKMFQNGSAAYPSRTLLREKLDDMYGATFTTDVQKKGEDHIITLRMDVVNERFLASEDALLHEALTLLAQLIFEPNEQNGQFIQSVVKNEKRSFIQRIEAIYDDKMRYANMRVTEEMFKGERYAVASFGTIEQVEAITAKSLYDYYEQMIQTNSFDLYIIGAINEEEVLKEVEQAFQPLIQQDRKNEVTEIEHKQQIDEKIIHEQQDLKQGKLHLGFRTNTTFADDDYVALQIFNGIFGGFAHSKLFMNVREKESLAYYASSQLESHKGLIMVVSGIEFNKYERALQIIREQFEAMKAGQFTDEELMQTKAMTINQLLEMADIARGYVELSYQQMISGHERTLQQWIEQIDAVTKEDVIKVANKIRLDTVYFLKGEVEAE